MDFLLYFSSVHTYVQLFFLMTTPPTIAPVGDRVVSVVSSTSLRFEKDVDLLSGLKVWECSLDLAGYLVENYDDLPSSEPSSECLCVLELGCGHAVPALRLLKEIEKRKKVLKTTANKIKTFLHDYSEETLRLITRRNVEINLAEGAYYDSIQYLGGKWEDLLCVGHENSLPESINFDIILCSEGVYKKECFQVLVDLCKKFLKPDTGRAFFSGKRYYFGCGGGTLGFRNFLEEENNNELQVEKSKTYADGKSNLREVVVVRGSSKPADEKPEKPPQKPAEKWTEPSCKRQKTVK